MDCPCKHTDVVYINNQIHFFNNIHIRLSYNVQMYKLKNTFYNLRKTMRPKEA